MQGEKKEQWMRLCELVPNEQDADKLLELVREINRLLEEKEECPEALASLATILLLLNPRPALTDLVNLDPFPVPLFG